MPFHFRAWEPTRAFGDPAQAAKSFNAAVKSLKKETPGLGEADLCFEVIDVRPSSADAPVEKFIQAVAGLFLQDFDQRSALWPNSRLLFAGLARSLTDWEPEGQRRSINKDVELFIRAAQSLGIGHYVCIAPDPPRPAGSDAPEAGGNSQRIMSALFAFKRYYSNPRHAATDAVALLDKLSADIAALIGSAQNREGFERLGMIGSYDDPTSVRDDEILLDEIRLTYQLGKRGRLSKYSPERALREGKHQATLELDLPSTSYALLDKIEEWVPQWAGGYAVCKNGECGHAMGAIGDPDAAQWLAGATFKMKRYEMLRDLGRLIGSNSIGSLRRRLGEARSDTTPLFLVIDDFIYAWVTKRKRPGEKNDDDYVVEGMKRAFKVVGCGAEDFVVVPSRVMPCDETRLSGDAQRRIIRKTGSKPVTLDGEPAPPLQDPEHYAAILIDPEATSDALGPLRVQRLAGHLGEIRAHAAKNERGGSAARNPCIIAYSQRESAGHVQQCLNLGAAAFAAKHRPYHLLFDLNRVLADAGPGRPSTDKASQFRILRSLKAHTTAKLNRDSGPAYIHGGLYRGSNKAVPSLDDFLTDMREETWIRSLPKADLHCHIGTCIDYPTVEMMALNTVGYMLGARREVHPPAKDDGAWAGKAAKGTKAADGAKAMLTKIARIVSLAEELAETGRQKPGSDADAPPLLILAAAAAAVVQRDGGLKFKPFGLGDAVIDHLRSIDERCALFEVGAALVAMISLYPRRRKGAAPYEAEDGAVDYLESLSKDVSISRTPADPEEFTLRAALDHALQRGMHRMNELVHRWDGRFTADQIRSAAQQNHAGAAGGLRQLIEALRVRVGEAERVLKRFLNPRKPTPPEARQQEEERKTALKWLADNKANMVRDRVAGGVHPLEPYVLAARAPEREGRRSGLQLYLQGADLLGSAHLQYPDNLLLAAYAITRDNARDNIVYSEVRCETTGYTRAGMSAVDATEMLRHGFNIASLFLATQPAADEGGPEKDPPRKWPLVRTNILLAAKRHKKEAEARKVVALLEAYLERRPADVERSLARLRYPQPFPSWWRPADVVGFDVSGDESRDGGWLAKVIEPLEARSSPITIHAGEAADAQSIWHAVYRLNATRIGHGLRLNEDQALLSYCVREGICMEMCPNSNAATNGFRCIPAFDKSPYPLLQYEYPLLQYMRAGMEVSLGTDNRYLHSQGRRNLTSEYIAAARLVGGLTRWEVLQIVKAGFKNAFLAKVEISEMLGAVEEAIYNRVVSNAA